MSTAIGRMASQQALVTSWASEGSEHYFCKSFRAIASWPCLRHVTSSSWPTETAFTVTVDDLDCVLHARTLKQMHWGKGLRAGGVYLILERVRFRHFQHCFEVDDTGWSCTESGLMNDQDDLRNQYCFAYLTRVILGVLKRPHLPEVEKDRLKIPLLPPWSRLMNGGTCLGAVHQIRSIDQVGIH